MAALHEWSRKAELSADRAGLLATQDPATATRVHMQLASGGHLEDLDATSFFAQGQEYDDSDLRDSVLKLLLIENRSHLFLVSRATELRRWVDSGDYTWILSGDYRAARTTRRPRSPTRPRRAPHETFKQSQDALGKLVHDVAGVLGSVKVWLDEQLRRGRTDHPADDGVGGSARPLPEGLVGGDARRPPVRRHEDGPCRRPRGRACTPRPRRVGRGQCQRLPDGAGEEAAVRDAGSEGPRLPRACAQSLRAGALVDPAPVPPSGTRLRIRPTTSRIAPIVVSTGMLRHQADDQQDQTQNHHGCCFLPGIAPIEGSVPGRGGSKPSRWISRGPGRRRRSRGVRRADSTWRFSTMRP